MAVNIDKMRADMRLSTRVFVLQIIGLLVAAFAAGAAWVKFFHG